MLSKMRSWMIAAALPAFILTGCASDGPMPINQATAEAQNSAAVMLNTGAALVNACVIDKASDTGMRADAAATAMVNTFDKASDDVVAGVMTDVSFLLSVGQTALMNIQMALAGLEPTDPQVMALAKQMPKGANFDEVFAALQKYLPIALAAAPEIVAVVKSFLSVIDKPSIEVTVDDVMAANAAMHNAFSNWQNATCVQ